jgi:hypothetical protein
VTAVTVEVVVRYLAGQGATWEVLYAYRDQGLAAAVAVLGQRGGAGRAPDGVFRSWFVQPCGQITVQVGGIRAPRQRVRVGEVLGWADRQLSAGQWARAEQLVGTWREARREAWQVRHEAATRARVSPCSPGRLLGLTDPEQRRLRLLAATEHTAAGELARLLRDAYAAPDRTPRQLELFD